MSIKKFTKQIIATNLLLSVPSTRTVYMANAGNTYGEASKLSLVKPGQNKKYTLTKTFFCPWRHLLISQQYTSTLHFTSKIIVHLKFDASRWESSYMDASPLVKMKSNLRLHCLSLAWTVKHLQRYILLF